MSEWEVRDDEHFLDLLNVCWTFLLIIFYFFPTENLTLKTTNIPIQWDNCSFNMFIIITLLVVELGKPSIFRVETL